MKPHFRWPVVLSQVSLKLSAESWLWLWVDDESRDVVVTVMSITDEGAAWFYTERSCLLPDYSSYWTVETLQPESYTLQSHKVAAGTECLIVLLQTRQPSLYLLHYMFYLETYTGDSVGSYH